MTVYQFGPFSFDCVSQNLCWGDTQLKIRARTAEVLLMLLEKRQEIVSKEDLFARVWHDTTVTENTLFQCIREIRFLFQSQDPGTTYIRTVPKHGYRWVYRPTTCLEKPLHNHTLGHEPTKISPNEHALVPRDNTRFHGRFLKIGSSIFLILLIAALVFFGMTFRGRSIEPVPTHDTDFSPAVAVLDFQNLSGDPQQAWFSSALAEAIRAEISASRRYRTISGETLQWLTTDLETNGPSNPKPDLASRIRDHLDCDYLVNGSFMADDREMRIHLTIRGLRDGTEIFSTVQSARMNHPLGVLDGLIAELNKGLGMSSNGPTGTALPVNEAAARDYANGLRLLRRFEPRKAIPFFERVIQLEPVFPMSYGSLSDAYDRLGYREKAIAMARVGLRRSGQLGKEGQILAEARVFEVEGRWLHAATHLQSVWTFRPNDPEIGLRLVSAYLTAGDLNKTNETLMRLRTNPRIARDPRLQMLEARAAKLNGDRKEQYRIAESVEKKGRRAGMLTLTAQALLIKGNALGKLTRHDEAFAALEESGAAFREAGDFTGYARAKREMGLLLWERGEPDRAKALFREALDLHERNGDAGNTADTHRQVGVAALEVGSYDEAEVSLDRALILFRELGGIPGEASTLGSLGLLAFRRKEYDQASKYFDDACFLFKKLGLNYQSTAIRVNHGMVLFRHGEYARAKAIWIGGLAAAEKAGHNRHMGVFLKNLGAVCDALGEQDESLEYYERALTHYNKMGNRYGQMVASIEAGRLSLNLGKPEQSEAHYRHAKELAERIKRPDALIFCLSGLVRVSLVTDQTERVELYMAEARKLLPEKVSRAYWKFRLLEIDVYKEGPLKDLDKAKHVTLSVLESASTSGIQGIETRAKNALALIYLEEKRLDLARKSLERMELEDAPTWLRIQTDIVDAKVRIAEGDLETSRHLLERAIAKAREMDDVELELDGLITLARWQRDSGNRDDARGLITQVRQRAKSHGLVYLIRRAEEHML